MRWRAAILALAGAVAVPAGAATYDCVVRPTVYASDVFSPFDNPIQTRLRIETSRSGAPARVSDPLIRQVAGGVAPGEVTLDSDSKLTVVWALPVMGRNLSQATMSFRAAILKDSGKVIVTAQPMGYQGRFFGRGSCAQLP